MESGRLVFIFNRCLSESNLKFIEYSMATHNVHMFIGERQDHCHFLLARRRNTPLVDHLTEMHMQANERKKV